MTLLLAAVMGPTLVGATLVAWLRCRYLVVVVVGGSMRPTLRPGDRLYARRTSRMPARGAIVVIRSDTVTSDDTATDLPRLLVKRVTAREFDPFPGGTGVVPPGQVYVRGDAKDSLDSRTWGAIPAEAVVGHVVGMSSRTHPGDHTRFPTCAPWRTPA